MLTEKTITALSLAIADMHYAADRAVGALMTCSRPVGYLTGSCTVAADVAEVDAEAAATADDDDLVEIARRVCAVYRSLCDHR